MWETHIWFMGQEDPLEKWMGTHLCILTWRTPQKEESGELLSMGLHRVLHDWATKFIYLIYINIFI